MARVIPPATSYYSGDKTKGFVEPASTTGNDYIYDANGNMTSDQNKGITAITYNHLNLPVQVNKGASDYIVYTYDAGGRKLAQQVFGSTPKVTDYMGEFIYEGNVLQFVNTEEGRIVMTGANPEYQYHLKDHLGNVRTTFTTVTTPEVNTATYETANLTAEMGKFLRMDKARRVNSTLFDRTNGSSPGFAERLNGTTNEKYGLARSIAVSSGDVVSAEVYAKYPDTNSANWLPALSTLMGNIATNTGNIVVDGSNYSNGNNPFNALFAQAHTPSGTAPQAYLNWMVFDKNWNLISSKSGYMQITTAGRETGSDVAHERLFTPSISITEPGYVYIYVSNEDLAAPKDVFFACPDEAFRGIGDDFSVTQVKTPIVQTEDYYPFGLTFNSYQRDSSMPDQYLYNGKELQDELSLRWLDYGARMYMPELGRWGVVDPLSEAMRRFSPYNYAYNDPIRFHDPDGMQPAATQQQMDVFEQAKKLGDEVYKNDESSDNAKSGDDKKTAEGQTANVGLVVGGSTLLNELGTAVGQTLLETGKSVVKAATGAVTAVASLPAILTAILVSIPASEAGAGELEILNQMQQERIARIEESPPIPNAQDLPWEKGKSPGKDWVWKGKGSPESGRGNWVNEKTGQKLHPDLDHPGPKGPHWGLQQPDGSTSDIFPKN